MNKRAIAIASLVFSVLSLIFILLSHVGLVRYMQMHLVDSHTRFVGSYSELPAAEESGRVVISFTTTPENADKLGPMIMSLLDQTVRVNRISLTVPTKYSGDSGYTGPSEYNLPKWYGDAVSIYRSGVDFGPGGKILPSLTRESEADTKIIYLEDNRIYAKDMVEKMVDASNAHPNSAIMIESANALLVKPSFFDASVLEHGKETYDDQWFLQKLKVPITKIVSRDTYRSYRFSKG